MPKVYGVQMVYPKISAFSCVTEEFCISARQGAYLKSEMMYLHFSFIRFETLVTYVGTPTPLSKQSMPLGWSCLATQILFDHLQLIVCMKRSDLRKYLICLNIAFE